MPEQNAHLDAYRTTFGPGITVAPGSVASRLIVVLFTNRCGSMVFTEMIGSSPDILPRYEVFNGDVVRNKSRQHGLTDFPAYLDFLFGRPRVTYTAKIHVAQLGFLAETGLLSAFAGGVQFFHVRRADAIAQAVSHSIARQTGRWTSFADSAPMPDPSYDFAEIRTILNTIRRETQGFAATANKLRLIPRDVIFEEFIADPAPVLCDAWDRLGVRHGTLDTGQTRLRRQATGRNSEFAERFRMDAADRDLLLAG